MKYPKYITKLVGGPITFTRITDGWLHSAGSVHPHDYDFAGPYDVAGVDLTGIDSIKVRYHHHAQPFVLFRVSPDLWSSAPTGIEYMNYDVEVMLKTGKLIPVYEEVTKTFKLSLGYTMLFDGHKVIGMRLATPPHWTDVEIKRGFEVTDLDTVEQVGKYKRGGSAWVTDDFQDAVLHDNAIILMARDLPVVLSEKPAVIERKAVKLQAAVAERDQLKLQVDEANRLAKKNWDMFTKARDKAADALKALQEVV